MGEPDTSDVNMGQQIFLEKILNSSSLVDKITYIDDKISKFVNEFKFWIIGLPSWITGKPHILYVDFDIKISIGINIKVNTTTIFTYSTLTIS